MPPDLLQIHVVLDKFNGQKNTEKMLGGKRWKTSLFELYKVSLKKEGVHLCHVWLKSKVYPKTITL